MKLKKNLLALITISIMLCSCLSGCWNSRDVNSIAFMTSIGFDKTEKGMLITIQVLNPKAIASQRSVSEPTVIVYKEEGKDISEIIRKIITQSSRKLNATHMSTVVFGEEFAKDGISEVLDFFSREHQNRTDIYFVVARGSTANEVLNTLTTLDTNPSIKLYSSIKASDQIWAATKSVKLIKLVNSVISDGIDPVLTGVEITEDRKGHDTIEMLEEVEADPLKIKGLAVFEKDNLVGWLDEDECKGFNYITGNVPSTMGYVEDESIGRITLEVTGAKSKRTASLENGKPAITVDINVKANIEVVKGNLDITKEENIKKIEQLAEEKGSEACIASLNKTQKELGIDIYGFGEIIHRTYPKMWGSMKDNWNNEFKDLPIKINYKITLLKTGTISNSFFMKEK